MPHAAVAILGDGADRAHTRALAAALPGCLDLVGAVDLMTAAAVLRRCSLFVGNDSGLMHMAAAVGAPTLGLFGPSRDVHYAPWGPRTAVVRTTASYDELMGAHRRGGGSASTAMDTLTVEMAEEGARALWAATRDAAA